MSLAPNGTPCSGPSAPPWAICPSAARAAVRARSASSVSQAWTSGSTRAERSNSASTSSTGDTCRVATRRAAWDAVSSCKATVDEASAMSGQRLRAHQIERFLRDPPHRRRRPAKHQLQTSLRGPLFTVRVERRPLELVEHGAARRVIRRILGHPPIVSGALHRFSTASPRTGRDMSPRALSRVGSIAIAEPPEIVAVAAPSLGLPSQLYGALDELTRELARAALHDARFEHAAALVSQLQVELQRLLGGQVATIHRSTTRRPRSARATARLVQALRA